uniref:ATP synthase subunit s, mitochondrial n=2 Tax=Cebus imitator TaxID=2715852 RepID=A0A2K5Q940_CEBIM
QMMLFGKVSQQLCGLKKLPRSCDSRYFWSWLNAVFNKVDYERIRDVGPDRAASEWLLRCGAMVRYHGQERWQKDYNHLPTGPLDKYKIQAIDATDSCIMSIGFDHMEGLEHVEKIRLCKCQYIEDGCLLKLSQLENLQKSILEMEIISCGNITDKGIVALRHLRNLKYLLLSDLPGVREKENLVQTFKTALPSLELKLQLM